MSSGNGKKRASHNLPVGFGGGGFREHRGYGEGAKRMGRRKGEVVTTKEVMRAEGRGGRWRGRRRQGHRKKR